MTDRRERAGRPVRSFLRRVGVQIVVSGSAMAAIHFGTGALPSLTAFLAPAEPAVASLEKPAAPVAIPVAEVREAPPAETVAEAPPLPEPAPPRPVQEAAAEKSAAQIAGVQRFDACDPACPSRDPLLGRAGDVPISADAGSGMEFPEVPDDAAEDVIEDGPASLLSLPGRALASAGRTTQGVLGGVGKLLPF